MNPNTILQWYTYNRITRKFIHVIRVDRSVYGTVLTIIIINTNHKKRRENNTHNYMYATLGDNKSIFMEVRSSAFGETFVVTFCQIICAIYWFYFFHTFFGTFKIVSNKTLKHNFASKIFSARNQLLLIFNAKNYLLFIW